MAIPTFPAWRYELQDTCFHALLPPLYINMLRVCYSEYTYLPTTFSCVLVLSSSSPFCFSITSTTLFFSSASSFFFEFIKILIHSHTTLHSRQETSTTSEVLGSFITGTQREGREGGRRRREDRGSHRGNLIAYHSSSLQYGRR